jgi:hypothetical protein
MPESNFDDNLPKEAPQNQTTYEQLRKKNREEYEKKMNNPYYRPVNPEEAPVVRRATQQQQQPTEEYQTGPKNKYGDVVLK